MIKTKRYGNLYPQIYDIDNLKLAHMNARRGKGWYEEVKMINANEDYYLKKLQDMLINKTYKTSEYQTFPKKDGVKERILYKLPYFPDRICQWAILQVIEPILMKNLIYDTYSAIPGRGIHLALDRVGKAMKDRDNTQYCFKFDVKKYYPSIDHEILKQQFRALFKDNDLLWLINEIIDSIEDGAGVPIGNYLSQWCGNIYLSEFDHWMKEEKKCKYYFRYMDDIVILHGDKQYLHDLRKEVTEYFSDNLKLRMKENWQVFPTFVRGLDFVGYRHFGDYILLRKSTAKNFKRKMRKLLKKCLNGEQMTYGEWCSINSYKGWIMWCDGKELTNKYVKPLEPFATKYYKEVVKVGKNKGEHGNRAYRERRQIGCKNQDKC